jgi:broad specificity phosphatase PhoE
MPIVLVRHAHTDWNGPPRRFQGRADVGLSQRGAREAAALGRRLPRPDRIISSPARRCRETMAALLGEVPDEVTIEPGLWEIDNGSFAGKIEREVAAAEPELWQAWCATPSRVRPGGGETLAEMQQRVRRAVDRVLAVANPAEDVLVLTHGGPIRTLLLAAERRPLDEFHAIEVANLECFRMTHDGDGLHLDRTVPDGPSKARR